VTATPDGGSFAVPDDAGYVDLFDSQTLTRTGHIPVSPGTQVSAVALAPDGRTMAATTADGRLRFADLRDRRPLGPLQPAHAAPAWSLAFSGDGRWLATAGNWTGTQPPLRLWDVRRARLVKTSLLSPPPAYATDVTFSPDGTRLAAAVNDGNGATAIEILSVPGLAQVKTVPAGAGTSVRFSPDGRLLVFGDVQGRVWLYDTRTWRPRGRPLIAHTGAVVTVNFSPDGQTLATTSDDGTTRLWDVPSGRPIGTALPGLAQQYVAAAFVEGRTHLLTLYENGRGYSWDINRNHGPVGPARSQGARSPARSGLTRCPSAPTLPHAQPTDQRRPSARPDRRSAPRGVIRKWTRGTGDGPRVLLGQPGPG
jgi:WD40 repeat protein